MDGGTVLDGSLPRRGSLNSLHRQSSGSFSHSSRLNSSPAANGLQANTANLNNLYRDLDKFTRYFIIKSVQVIVQSRIGSNKRLKTECKPTGNDWFNINITDIAEVSDRTKAALDTEGFSVRSNWRVCCEISLKTNDGGRVILEHWIISNKSNFNSSQNQLSSKLNNNSASPKTQSLANRSSPVHLTSSNGGISPLNANNSTNNRVRYATFSSTTTRTRLNSIDDCSGDKNSSTNKLLVGTNNENFDIKSSISCFSLTTTPASYGIDQTATSATAAAAAITTNSTNATTITASPSITSLPNNQAHNAISQQQQQQHQGNKTGPTSSIYTIYNRMSLLLKTLMTTTHIVPAYRLASRTPPGDSCVICYRVYSSPSSSCLTNNNKTNPTPAKGSIEDISYTNIESPTKRSSSTSSFGSVNIREFVAADELDHFCPILKLGSIKTEVNELEVSLCYRTDVKNSNHLMRSPLLRDRYNKFADEDCITAAKQLLAGNNLTNQDDETDDSFEAPDNNQNNDKNEALDCFDQPLMPAFAAKEQNKTDKTVQDPNLVIIDTAFDVLLQVKESESSEDITSNNNNNLNGTVKLNKPTCKIMSNGHGRSTNTPSEPIEVPQAGPFRSKPIEFCQNLSAGSTPKSLTDSFVFVDLNPPFASEEQNDINSFFHGPSPAFSNGFDNLKDVDELTNQLAVIEANASQIDEFIDNICVSEDEDEQD